MLNPFNCYKFTITENKNISSSKTSCKCPAKLVNIERVCRRSRNCFAIYTNMNKLVSFIDISFSDRFNSYFTCSFVLRKNLIADFDFFNRLRSVLSSYKRSRNKAVRSAKPSIRFYLYYYILLYLVQVLKYIC